MLRRRNPIPVRNTASVWGWDASNHDWGRGSMNLASARQAGIPVLGAYHYLWPDPPSGIEAQVHFWMDCVAKRTPWWHEHPWIWQIDAEQQGLPRPPSPDEIRRAVDAVHDRMARERTTGYVIVYAPRWLYVQR